MKVYEISWNNEEHPSKIFGAYKDAENEGIATGGQWVITEKEQEWLKI